MGWTPQQQEAIEYRGKNILLAAAAGSGKTAVLVQRIIELIIKDNVSVNELLVLTFTDAAAGEMREKIKKAIYNALKEHPENKHLQKQKLLIHSANISTIHRLGIAFALSPPFILIMSKRIFLSSSFKILPASMLALMRFWLISTPE